MVDAFATMHSRRLEKQHAERFKSREINKNLGKQLADGSLTKQAVIEQYQQTSEVKTWGTSDAMWHATKHKLAYDWADRNCGDKPHAYTSQEHPANKAIVQYQSGLSMR